MSCTTHWRLALVYLGLAACGDQHLRSTEGALLITVLNPGERAAEVSVTGDSRGAQLDVRSPTVRPTTVVEVPSVPAGLWELRVATLSSGGESLRSVQIEDILVTDGQTSKVTVDFADLPPLGEPCADLALPVCTACEDDLVVETRTDARCGPVDCTPYDRWRLDGDNSAVGQSTCLHAPAIAGPSGQCAGAGVCATASEALCPPDEEQTALTAQACEQIVGCEEGAPSLRTYPDGTACGVDRTCQRGQCVTEGPVEPEVGCSDGTREGFLDLATYPAIAGCSGAWSVPGVTAIASSNNCSRQGGNHGARSDGQGCSAEDLCAPGWHICRGREEVARRSPTGCDGAVPTGAPDKSLLFAVAQNSNARTVCEETDQTNDVFGCGNLGVQIPESNGCAPLNRALASMQSDACGFNEAEPPLGPWQCVGGTGSHLREGSVVTKIGCPNGTCSYDGQPVHNTDKGGVLCCRGQEHD